MGHKVLIIAEVGSCHNGNLETAKQLIEVAYSVGADLVKFQMVYASGLMHRTHSGYSAVKGVELSISDHYILQKYAKLVGIPYMATPCGREELDLLISWGVPYLKIASGDLTFHELINRAVCSNIPTILSTGFATGAELIQLELALKARPWAVLHCVGAYPATVSDYNLHDICALADLFGCYGGLSDHTLSILLPSLAVAHGARVIEKHLTLCRNTNQVGLDHGHSLEPYEFKEMVKFVREAEQLEAHEPMQVKKSEKELCVVARRGTYFRRSMQQGERLGNDDVTFLRPYNGMHPYETRRYVGKQLCRSVDKDAPVTPECFQEGDKNND